MSIAWIIYLIGCMIAFGIMCGINLKRHAEGKDFVIADALEVLCVTVASWFSILSIFATMIWDISDITIIKGKE